MKPRVFVTRRLHQEALDLLAHHCEVEVWGEETPPSHAFLVEKAYQCDGLLTLLTDPIDSQVLSAPGLKIVSQYAVGTDNIDLVFATQHGIPVGHTPGVLTEACADLTLALMLATARRVVEAHNEVVKGIWRPWGPFVLTGADLFGATLGIIGFGRIGQAVARRAAGFDMRILYSNPKRNLDAEEKTGAEFVSQEELLKQSDFVSLHAYYSPENHHMIDFKQFELMKKSAFLINTSRGSIVNPAALTWALQTGEIAGAGLDVFEPEPIPADHPLLSMKNVVITPHIASASSATRARMALISVNNLLAGLKGEKLPFCANPQVYEK